MLTSLFQVKTIGDVLECPQSFFFLHHDPEYQLLICKLCRHAVNANSVATYCHSSSHPKSSLAERKEAQEWALTLNVFRTDTWDYDQVLSTPIPYATIYPDAYVCPFEDCRYTCTQEDTFRKHATHAKTTQPNRNSSLYQVFGTRRKTFNIIREMTSHSVDMNDAVKQVLDLFKIQKGAFLDQFDTLSRNNARKTPWLDRTQFPHYLDALSIQAINSLLVEKGN